MRIKNAALEVAALVTVASGAFAGANQPASADEARLRPTSVASAASLAPTGPQVMNATEKREWLMERGATSNQADFIVTEDAQAQLAAAVPSCVSGKYSNPSGPYQNVDIKNDCSSTVRVKVIWGFATDSRCYTIAAYQTVRESHFNQFGADSYDGLKSC